MPVLSTTAAAVTATAVMALAAAAPVRASDDTDGGTEQRLLACEDISDPAGKLACFNAVVEGLKQTSVEAAPASLPEAEQDSVSASGSDPDAANDSSTGGTMEAATVRRDEAETEDDEAKRSTVVRSWQNLDGRFSVELDNGQVWRETQGSRVGLPEAGDSVELSKGRFGGYRMKVESITRIAWVRRAK